jgi:glucose/arabinose dehydrogenase
MAGVNLVVGNDDSNTLSGSSGKDLIYGFDPNGPQGQVSAIAATRVATGLSQPDFAVAPAGDTDRLFIVERTGQIKILDLNTGQVLATPFLDLTSQITTAGEGGLLGLAFDPDFAHNGLFYVDLTNPSDDTEIRRYHVSADPNIADPASASPVITIDQPAGLTNHKAGWIAFGPDGDLYAALGDGGGSGDPSGNGQNIDSLLGKMLRLDVHGDAFPGDPARNYAIPADNMFAATAGADEIFALGLRNPFRDSFDRGTGDFFIADVGQNQFEEINIGVGGANYGWSVFEGPSTFAGGTPSGGTLTGPVYYYDHTVGHAIIGGYVYRGQSEGLQGQYFFADEVDDKVFTLRFNGSTWVATERTSQITTDAGAIDNPTSFDEDGRGNLYLTDFDGDVFRLTPMVASADQADTLRGLAGDDMLFGGSGDDLLDGGAGADALSGGPGIDTATYASSPAGVAVNLATGHGFGGDAEGDILTGIENLIGTASADILVGGAEANALTGGPGNDTIDGGAGINTAVYSGLHSDYRLTSLSAGSFQIVDTRSGSPDGSDTVANIQTFKFADGAYSLDQLLSTHVAHDFGGDGKNDFLWRSDAGTIVTWDISGGQVLGSNDFGQVPANWKIASSGDFNGDGRSDLLWRSDAGTVVTWDMNGSHVLSTNTLGSAPADWKIAGLGDFNGDGKSDLLWRSDAGTIVTWDMNDNHVLSSNVLGTVPDNWKIASTGDFNGDHKTDILWRSDAGTVATWDIDDNHVLSSNVLGSVPDNWKIAGTGDFGSDGKTDILWRSDAGTVATWDIDDSHVLGTHDFGVAPTDWHII